MGVEGTMAGLVLDLADEDRPGILHADQTLSHKEAVAAAARRGAWLRSIRRPGPFHVAVLSDNTVDYLLWLEAAALVGAAIVGGNTTHRGDELARDLSHTQCQVLIAHPAYLHLVDGLDLGESLGHAGADADRVLVMGTERESAEIGAFAGATAGDVIDPDISPATLGYLLFTSGTSGAPKAVKCSQGRLAAISGIVAQMFELGSDTVAYGAMPLFHSNALMAGWGPSLAAKGAIALPATGRFSASGVLPDIRRFKVTYMNYVGKPLSYILATPEQPDDADNTLVTCFGNEAAADDVERFAERFSCRVIEAYGSSEGGAAVQRTPDTPRGALGVAGPDTCVLDPDSEEECPRAIFDERGRLLNADVCIGELVNKAGGSSFEGYWSNDQAMEDRTRNGWYWTGDLAYRDEAGFFYFAGRDHDWIRVDGENFATAPVERILSRFSGVVLAAAYAVPDEHVGDQVMAALELSESTTFDPDDFASFLASQDDLGTKWAPKYVRISKDLPKTATSKVVKKSLRAERWRTSDPVYWRPTPELVYERLSDEAAQALDDATSQRPI